MRRDPWSPLFVSRLLVLYLSIFLVIPLPVGYAQVTTALTASGLGTRISEPVVLPSGKTNYDITGGTRPGNGPNLFHSFGEFSLATNHIANFLNETALPTSNILSRVTGGNPSNIWGTIQTTGFGTANLYLINPAGIVFGPTASLNVGGTFNASTADYLRMTDGARFHADLARPSTLSLAPVEAFGFTVPRPVAISIQGSTLQVASGQSLSIIGGNIDITQAGTGALLRAPSGQIVLASVGSAGEVVESAQGRVPSLDVTSFTALGDITVSGSSMSVTSGTSGAGTILVRGRQLTMTSAFLNAGTGGLDGAPIGIDIAVSGDLTLTNSGMFASAVDAHGSDVHVMADHLRVDNSFLGTQSQGTGAAGSVVLNARTVEVLNNNGFVFADNVSSGPAGDISLHTETLLVKDGSQIAASPNGSGPGGNLNITAKIVEIRDTTPAGFPTGLFVSSRWTGNAGRLTLVTEDLNIISDGNAAQISAAAFGSGRGGSIDITADRVFMSGNVNSPFQTGIFPTTFGTGQAGNLSLTAQTIEMMNYARMQASSFGPGNAGNVNISTGTLELINGSHIGASAVFGTGAGGSATLTAKDIFISGVSTATKPFTGPDFTGLTTATNAGAGGPLNVTAENIVLTNKGIISSQTIGSGAAGSIGLHLTGTLEVTNGGTISASAFGSGRGGNIDISAERITVSGVNPNPIVNSLGQSDLMVSGIASQYQSPLQGGSSGDIQITAANLQLLDGGHLGTTTYGPGKGGNLSVAADSILISGSNPLLRDFAVNHGTDPRAAGSAITASTESVAFGTAATGDAGTIRLQSRDLKVADRGFITAETGSLGKGGNIEIVSDQVNISNSGFVSAESLLAAQAGNITVQARDVRVAGMANSPDPFVTDFTGFSVKTVNGAGGTMNIIGDTLMVTDNALITSATTGSGSAGSIHLQLAKNLTVTTGGTVSASTSGAGEGGNINVSAAVVQLNGSTLEATTESSGHAGAITLNTGQLTLLSGGQITTNTTSTQPGAGNAGRVAIQGLEGTDTTTDLVTLVGNGTTVSSNTAGPGQGGNIQIQARQIQLDDRASLSATATGAGHAGSIALNVDTLMMTTGGEISSSSTSTGNAGNITIHGLASPAVSVTLTESAILTQAQGTGAGGSIDIDATALTLSRATISASVKDAPQGGNPAEGVADITLRTPTLEMTGGTVTAETSGTRNAGSIVLNTNQLSVMSGSQISSSSLSTRSDGGSAGTVSIAGLQGNGTRAQSLLVSGSNSFISTDTEGAGQGGNIQIAAAQMQVEELAKITAETSGMGKAGNITLTGDALTVMAGGRIEASTSGAGDGGAINIATSGDVTVSGVSRDGQVRSGIFAKTQTPSSGTGGGTGGGGGSGGAAPQGNAGDITITAKNLGLTGGAQIDSSTTSGGTGGSVMVTATENIIIAGSGTRLTSDATRGDGQGGSITLVAKKITVQNGASVTAATGGQGDAGNISLTAFDQLLLQSAGTVTTSTSGSGKGGTITIQASRVLLDGSGTAIAADTLRPFADMTITINILHPNVADLVVQLDSPSGTRVALLSRVGGSGDDFIGTQFNDQATNKITSGSAPFTGTFRPREPLAQLINELIAGNWTLNVRDQTAGNAGSLESWTLQIGAHVFQSTGGSRAIPDNGNVRSSITVAGPAGATVLGIGEAPGIGGDVMVTAGTVTVQNGATMSATSRGSGKGGTLTVRATGPMILSGAGSGLFTDAEASGTGGDINVTASRMTVDRGAKISAASSGTGGAGTITINAGSEFLSTSGSVTTQSLQASGGNITLLASDIIRLRDSQITSSVFGGPQTAGGNIFIDPNFVILQNSQIIAQAFQGQGGRIDILFGRAFLADANSVVSASSALGVNGPVNLQGPFQNLSGALVPLNQDYLQAATLLAQRCAAWMADAQTSTFVVVEHEGLPREPGGVLPSSLEESQASVTEQHQMEPIVVAAVSGPFSTAPAREQAPISLLDRTCRR